MIFQVFLGSLFICLCVVVQTFFMGAATSILDGKGHWIVEKQPMLRRSLALCAVTFWLVLALTVAIWLWAILFLSLNIFTTLEEALYFSIVAFTTLGFGDVIIDGKWRLLSGFLAANGLIMFSLTTAFLIEFLKALRRAAATQAHSTRT